MNAMFSKYNVTDQFMYIMSDIYLSTPMHNERTNETIYAKFDQNLQLGIGLPWGDKSNFYLPALQNRKVFPRSAFEELCWYLRGSSDANELIDKGIGVWKGNSSREFLDSRGLTELPEGNIGKSYGYQFRHGKVDQLLNLINTLKKNPTDRRLMIDLWNVNDLDQMALPPCVFNYNFMVDGDDLLHLKMTQRSADMVLGVPANINIGAFFLALIGTLTRFKVGDLTLSMTNAHMYYNHNDAYMMMKEEHKRMNTHEREWNTDWKDTNGKNICDMTLSNFNRPYFELVFSYPQQCLIMQILILFH
jgi:thymidylate synthase